MTIASSFKKTKSWLFLGVAGLATSPMAMANDNNKGLETFKNTIAGVIKGDGGKAVALIALLLGGLIGLAKSSAWPALTGLAIAAIFGLGPFLVETIFDMFGSIETLG